MLHSRHAATACLVQRNAVPSTQMRCMISANRRAKSTMALFMPRCLAIFISPGLEPAPSRRTHQHALGCLVERRPHHLVAAARYGTRMIVLAGLVPGGCQSKYGSDRF